MLLVLQWDILPIYILPHLKRFSFEFTGKDFKMLTCSHVNVGIAISKVMGDFINCVFKKKVFSTILLLLLPVPYDGQAKHHFIDSILSSTSGTLWVKASSAKKQKTKTGPPPPPHQILKPGQLPHMALSFTL